MPELAIVTGAGHGIGEAIAHRLADDGYRVVVADADGEAAARVAAEVRVAGGVAEEVIVDVREPAQVDAMVAATIDRHGRVDVLVNNAGVMGAVHDVAEYPFDEWRRVLAVDLDGVFLCIRAVVPHMVARGAGRIITISSISGKQGNPRMPAYAAAKAGVIGLTKSVGRELAQTGVLVNCVTPGGVSGTNILGTQDLDVVEGNVPASPMGRLAEPREVAAMVSWLAGPEVSFSTGAVFDLSGGRADY